MIKQLGLQSVRALEPPLAQREMFLYLNKRHKTILPILAGALKDMKKDGTYNRIKNNFFE